MRKGKKGKKDKDEEHEELHLLEKMKRGCQVMEEEWDRERRKKGL